MPGSGYVCSGRLPICCSIKRVIRIMGGRPRGAREIDLKGFSHVQERHRSPATVIRSSFHRLIAAGAVEGLAGHSSHEFDLPEALGSGCLFAQRENETSYTLPNIVGVSVHGPDPRWILGRV